MPLRGEQDEGTAVDRLRRQQKALADFGLEAFRSTDLDDVLHRGAALVSDGLGIRLAKVLELLPGGDRLRVRAGVNWKPGVVGRVEFGAGEDSPAGYALACSEPVISPDTARETRFGIPPVLVEHGVRSMANVVIAGEERPFGVLEVDATERRELDQDDITFLTNCANLLAAAIDRHRIHRALEGALNEQRIVVQEMAHRVKNLLALVQSLARQTAGDDPVARAFVDDFLGRFEALVRAETLVLEHEAGDIDFRRLVSRSVEPFEEMGAGAMTLQGDAVRVPPRIGRFVGLVLHELGTNAVKHGALSQPEGTVEITWEIEPAEDGRQLRLCWSETGGPAVTPPDREGFGTRLLTTLAAYELNGITRLEHRAGGVIYELVFPLPAT